MLADSPLRFCSIEFPGFLTNRIESAAVYVSSSENVTGLTPLKLGCRIVLKPDYISRGVAGLK